jgi:hypothetical protein
LGDADDLAAKVQYVFEHPEETVRIVERGQEVYRSHKWSSQRLRFVKLVGVLLEVIPESTEERCTAEGQV